MHCNVIDAKNCLSGKRVLLLDWGVIDYEFGVWGLCTMFLMSLLLLLCYSLNYTRESFSGDHGWLVFNDEPISCRRSRLSLGRGFGDLTRFAAGRNSGSWRAVRKRVSCEVIGRHSVMFGSTLPESMLHLFEREGPDAIEIGILMKAKIYAEVLPI